MGNSEPAIQLDTYVKVDRVEELSYEIVRSDIDGGRAVKHSPPLSQKCIDLIIACLKQFKLDIEFDYQSRIFK